MSLKSRIPTIQQISAVYGVITIIIYGWTMLQFFWRLPSWNNFFTAGDIFTVLAYSMATNLLESLTVLLVPLLLCIILPGKWFKEVFVSKGSWMVVLGLGYTMYLSRQLSANIDNNYPAQLIQLTLVVGVLIFCLTFLLDRVSLLRKLMEEIADRASIFSYIFIPVSLISLLVVIARNIF